MYSSSSCTLHRVLVSRRLSPVTYTGPGQVPRGVLRYNLPSSESFQVDALNFMEEKGFFPVSPLNALTGKAEGEGG